MKNWKIKIFDKSTEIKEVFLETDSRYTVKKTGKRLVNQTADADGYSFEEVSADMAPAKA